MSETGCQHPQGGHFLLVVALHLGFLFPCDIANDLNNHLRLTARVRHRVGVYRQDPIAALPATDHPAPVRRSRLEGVADERQLPAPFVAKRTAREDLRERTSGRIPADPIRCHLVGLDHPVFPVDHHHSFLQRVEQGFDQRPRLG